MGLTPAGRGRLEALQARRAGFETRLRAELGDARIEDIRQSLRSPRPDRGLLRALTWWRAGYRRDLDPVELVQSSGSDPYRLKEIAP